MDRKCKICSCKIKLPALRCQTCNVEACKGCMLSEEWLHFENRCPNEKCTGSVFTDVTKADIPEPQYFSAILDLSPESNFMAPDQIAKRRKFQRCNLCE